MPASVCHAYDCSVCYVRCEASPERLAASGTAGGSHPSVTLASYQDPFCLFRSCSLLPLKIYSACFCCSLILLVLAVLEEIAKKKKTKTTSSSSSAFPAMRDLQSSE